MRLSVIIATRDRASSLARALDSLGRQRHAPEFETIVVDNGSSDATPRIVDERWGTASLGATRIVVPQPNRAAARNAGLARAQGDVVVFVDDDVEVPEGFLAAHAAAQAATEVVTAISGPILNVPSYDDKPLPTGANFSRAFFCTCNVSVPRSALVAVGGFDEGFDLYGWEDTDLGMRLRRSGVRRRFAWDAYLYHIKPPTTESLDDLARKSAEKGRMAARLLAKDSSVRTRLATGAHPLNEWRARAIAPRRALPWYFGIAADARVPGPFRALARAGALDGLYNDELRRARRLR